MAGRARTMFVFSDVNHIVLRDRDRQPDAKRRASRLTFDLDISLMFFDNPLADVQPQSAPFAVRFRREKWLENVRFDLIGNAAAGIGDFDNES